MEERTEVYTRDATRISFRIKVSLLMFFKRMTDHFYEEGYIAEPKFSLLAKACLNIIGNRYAQFEEVNMANFVQKRIQQARGPNVVYYRQVTPQQQEKNRSKQEASTIIPPELRRPEPVDRVKEPDWLLWLPHYLKSSLIDCSRLYRPESML